MLIKLALIATISTLLLVFFQPRWLLATLAKISPRVKYFALTNARIAALTIDDGPDPNWTPQILDILAHYQVHATFFLISSKVGGNDQLISRIVKEGHEIGNHLTEDKWSIYLSPTEFENAVSEADKILRQFSEIRWLRPAGGWYRPHIIETARQYNYQVALGSIFPYDTHIRSSRFASCYILSKIRPGAILVLHEGRGRGENTLSTLASILPQIRQRGYKLVTLSTLFADNP